MPPLKTGKHLTDEQIAAWKLWVAQGAEWQKHWSFITPQRPAFPRISNKRWPRNPIDDFILARLDRERLTPSPEADKATLIRRVTFDLTGLPPTPAEVDAFLADQKRSEEHTSELQSPMYLVCRLLLEKKKQQTKHNIY